MGARMVGFPPTPNIIRANDNTIRRQPLHQHCLWRLSFDLFGRRFPGNRRPGGTRHWAQQNPWKRRLGWHLLSAWGGQNCGQQVRPAVSNGWWIREVELLYKINCYKFCFLKIKDWVYHNKILKLHSIYFLTDKNIHSNYWYWLYTGTKLFVSINLKWICAASCLQKSGDQSTREILGTSPPKKLDNTRANEILNSLNCPCGILPLCVRDNIRDRNLPAASHILPPKKY